MLYLSCLQRCILTLALLVVSPGLVKSDPINGTLLLNNQALYTTQPSIQMIMIATGGSGIITQVKVQADDGVWSDWMPYTPFLSHSIKTLTPGTKQFCVVFRDSESTESEPACASIEYRIPVSGSLGKLKINSINQGFRISGCRVTAVFQETATVYLSDASGVYGMKCLWNGLAPAPGATIDIEGVVVYTATGIPQLYLTRIEHVGASTPVAPITMRCRSVGGDHPALITGGFGGADNTYCFIQTTGRVIAVESEYFRINDGALRKSAPGLKVLNYPSVSQPSVGDYITVEGIVERSSSNPFEPEILPLNPVLTQHLYGN